MTQRIDYLQQSPELFKKLGAVNALVSQSSIEKTMRPCANSSPKRNSPSSPAR
jgi:hypothetical protein